MKKTFISVMLMLFSTAWCFTQAPDSGYMPPSPNCRAFFSYYYNDSINTLVAAYPYNFIAQSYGNVVKWHWDFGDGSSSAERNPMHFYSIDEDTVLVCLDITTYDSCKSGYCTQIVLGSPDVPPPPQCNTDFDVAIMESFPPAYHFTPNLMQSTLSCLWDFGDGSFSDETSPSHQYDYSGNYPVCLQVTYANGCIAYACDTLEVTGYDKDCNAFWEGYPRIHYDSISVVTGDTVPVPKNYMVYFQDYSTGEVISWNWSFGDGASSIDQNPYHMYGHDGIFEVCLEILTADSCQSSYCAMVIVGSPTEPTDCEADFTISVIKTNPPAYQFIPDTLDMMVSYHWDFGDGNYSNEISPTHRYEFDGRIPVNLNMIFQDGCSAFKFDTLQAEGYNHECRAYWEAYDAMTPYVDPSDTSHAFWGSFHQYHFYDRSIGNVVQWNWSFGDGSGSTEANPMHMYLENGIYPVCLTIETNNQCTSTYWDTLYVGLVPDCSLFGTVVDFNSIGGCGLMIMTEDNQYLEPAEIVPNFVLKKGQRVRFSYTELKDRASVCMVGKIVRIDCITEITDEPCKASFVYSPLPWISSWPPIYQFENQSTGNMMEIVWDLGDGTITSEISPAHRYQYSGFYDICLTIQALDGCTDTYCETAYFEGINPQPGLCDHYIRLTTDVILNGQTCNGSASAALVDSYGNSVQGTDYQWSTGESGPVIYNLCPGITYSVVVTDPAGCSVSGSFQFGGDSWYPDSLIGYWNYQQSNMDFIFNLPVYSDSVYCEWDFGDGNSAQGPSVNHTYETDEEQIVLLRVYDLSGNLLFDQEIKVIPENTTGMNKSSLNSPVVYPVPADEILFLHVNQEYHQVAKIEILTTGGQLLIGTEGEKQGEGLFKVNVSSLPSGYYLGRLQLQDGSIQSFRFVK